MSKKDKIEYVKSRIAIDDEFAIQGLLAVDAADSSMPTGTGFRNCDGYILGSYASQYRQRKWLSEPQLRVIRRKMLRYARQLVERLHEPEWVGTEIATQASLPSTPLSGSAGKVESDADIAGWACCL